MKHIRHRSWLPLFLMAVVASPAEAEERLGPFTETPRSVRSRAFDVKHVRLELELDWANQEIRGRAVHRLSLFRPSRSIRLDACEMTVSEVCRLQNLGDDVAGDASESLAFEQFPEHVRIDLGREIEPGEELVVALDYRIVRPRLGGHFVVPDEYEPEKGNSFWTQSEPEYARYWYPCFDSPNDRVSSEVLVTVPQDYFVLSNGRLTEKSAPHDGRRTWHWVHAKTHVPYLISVVAGQFEAYRQEADGVPIVSYVPEGMLAHAERSFGKTAGMMRFFNRKIGVPYPWSKYAQICVDEYMWGGMEHTSATTLTLRTLHDERAALDYSSDGLVAHELAHQWFGDLLTCKDWGELWLNESFATFFTTVWYEHDRGIDEATWARYREAQSYLEEDEKRYRRPIVTYRYKRPGNMFDRHSYPKGARVLHMLRFVLGEEMFWRSIRHYTEKNRFRVVETADLRVAVEEATGQGLNWFFNQWLYRGGHPEYEVSTRWDDEQRTLRMTVKQVQKVDSLTPLFRMPVDVQLVNGEGAQTRRITVDKREETFTFALSERPKRVRFDPENWILKKLKIEKSKQAWLAQLADDPYLMCRHRAVEALKEMTSDHQVREALIRAARKDAFWGIRQSAAEALAEFRAEAVRDVLIQVAQSDNKADVRRAAVESLADFPNDETAQALRQVIENDRSYETVAAALRALVKVDREGCRPDLVAALETPSHREVILRAAAESLAEIEDRESLPTLLKILEPPAEHERRMAVMNAVAKLGGGDAKITAKLAGQLSSSRIGVRRAAIKALGKTGDRDAVEILREHKTRETSRWLQKAADEAIESIESGSDLKKLKSKMESLEKKNRVLEERLQRLEEARE